jgi:hypothetical protein
MPKLKKDERQVNEHATKPDSLWRKPIALDAFEDEDPLAALYQGREAGNSDQAFEIKTEEVSEKAAELYEQKAIQKVNAKKSSEQIIENDPETETFNSVESTELDEMTPSKKITEAELKKLLRIKDEFFHFTDIREILRGKSFDIYACLQALSGNTGFCKIKHLDLMSKLDISRPTLFKQQDWLARLHLIEKRNVPGDHLGTSYTIHRLEEVLPVPEALLQQLEVHIESFRNA